MESPPHAVASVNSACSHEGLAPGCQPWHKPACLVPGLVLTLHWPFGVCRYPFLVPPPETPRCKYDKDGRRCGWSGAGPTAERNPSCTRDVAPVVLPSPTPSASASPSLSPPAAAPGAGALTVAPVTRDAGLKNLAALLNVAPLDLLPDVVTTPAAYSAFMG